MAFEAARSFDLAARDAAARPWLRTVTALAKYRTAEQAVWSASRAIEVFGGIGYTEEFVTARLLRDAQVLTVWEGPANIQALELLRLVKAGQGGLEFIRRADRGHRRRRTGGPQRCCRGDPRRARRLPPGRRPYPRSSR